MSRSGTSYSGELHDLVCRTIGKKVFHTMKDVEKTMKNTMKKHL